MLYLTISHCRLTILWCWFWIGNADVFTTGGTHFYGHLPISGFIRPYVARNICLRSIRMGMAYVNLWSMATAKKKQNGIKSEFLTEYYADECQP